MLTPSIFGENLFDDWFDDFPFFDAEPSLHLLKQINLEYHQTHQYMWQDLNAVYDQLVIGQYR